MHPDETSEADMLCTFTGSSKTNNLSRWDKGQKVRKRQSTHDPCSPSSNWLASPKTVPELQTLDWTLERLLLEFVLDRLMKISASSGTGQRALTHQRGSKTLNQHFTRKKTREIDLNKHLCLGYAKIEAEDRIERGILLEARFFGEGMTERVCLDELYQIHSLSQEI